ncbi:MAG: MBL fold metallo-hydrolase [Ornithinimicrobium sp.]
MGILISRRLLLRSGAGGIAFGAVALAAGCASDTSTTSGSDPEAGGSGEGDDVAGETTARPSSPSAVWERANLGFVSAYVLARRGQAIVVDTGTEGSESDIEAVLQSLGLSWGEVADVILTHSHPDHIGSAAAIAQAAPDAVFHAGEADIPAIDIGRSVSSLIDGDRVFDLTILHTPGHTPGHVSVHDTANGVLVAGDALTGGDGGAVALPDQEYTPDYEEALRSVEYLGTFNYATAYFGHGEPVTDAASDEVRALAQQG